MSTPQNRTYRGEESVSLFLDFTIVVISKAQELGMILISLNGDFANIFNYPPNNYQGIVALQVKNHPQVLPQIVSRLKDYLSANPDIEHYKGKLFLVEVHRIRIRQ